MRVAFEIVVGLAVVIILIRMLENRFVYFPPKYPEGFVPPEHYGLRVEEVWLVTEDRVKLNAFFLAHPPSSMVILWFHGNAENIGMGVQQMKALANLGVNILELDYRGYGKSEGSPDEAGVYRDADAAYDYLVQTRHFQPRGIIVFGHSLGGAVAVDVASRRECGGLIVQSSFTSVKDMTRRLYPVPLSQYVPKSRFDSLEKIQRVRVPILIVHGTRDEVVPFSMGEMLYRAALEPKLFFAVEGAGHNDVLEAGGEEYLRRFRAFIDGVDVQSRDR